jgi:arabinofuranosyltransferase
MTTPNPAVWRAALVGLFVLFTYVLFRTAWLSDDAYITFRTVDNVVNGYGLRWNVAERVQSYTHPLWMLLVIAPYALTREAFFTPIFLQMALALATVALIAWRLAIDRVSACLALLILVCSKAFVEYSTSGLENPLTHLLLVAFFIVYWRKADRRSEIALWFVTSLLLLTRLDAGVLVLPALLARKVDRRMQLRSAVIGLTPIIGWTLFSIVYYGFPFPNTAYAKLQTGIPAGILARQGLWYFADGLKQDPNTLLATIAVSIAALVYHRRESWPIVAGIALYCLYIVRIGGDFMTGRFLTAPLLCALALFVHLKWKRLDRVAMPLAVAFLAIGLFATTRPPLTSTNETFILSGADGMGFSGVADERAFYYRYTGLLRWTREVPLPHNQMEREGREARAAGAKVAVQGSVGLFGYFAGPGVHVIDHMALADPLLAREPSQPDWRIGHFPRAIPEGYFESIATGTNLIRDSTMAMKYEQMKLVTQGPIWSKRRWRTIRQLNLGW